MVPFEPVVGNNTKMGSTDFGICQVSAIHPTSGLDAKPHFICRRWDKLWRALILKLPIKLLV